MTEDEKGKLLRNVSAPAEKRRVRVNRLPRAGKDTGEYRGELNWILSADLIDD